MVIRDEDHPDPPGGVLAGDTLQEWGRTKPWHYTPPLIIQTDEDADRDEIREEIDENISTNKKHSDPREVGRVGFSGYLVSCEDLGKLARIDGVTRVEIEGYGKTMSI